MRRFISASKGLLHGTPGLTTTKSKGVIGAATEPSCTAIPRASKAATSRCNSGESALSTASTFAPSRCNSSAAASPLLPRPMTRTFLFSSEVMEDVKREA